MVFVHKKCSVFTVGCEPVHSGSYPVPWEKDLQWIKIISMQCRLRGAFACVTCVCVCACAGGVLGNTFQNTAISSRNPISVSSILCE